MKTYLQMLDEQLPEKFTFSYVQKNILAKENKKEFLKAYFPPNIRLILCFPEYYFENFDKVLTPKHRSQLIGLFCLCRYPLQFEKNGVYGSEFLHKIKRSSDIAIRLKAKETYPSIMTLGRVIPIDPSKHYLTLKALFRLSKTSQLSNYFTDEVLQAIGLPKEDYRRMKSFFFYRNQIIGLLHYFKVPLRPLHQNINYAKISA